LLPPLNRLLFKKQQKLSIFNVLSNSAALARILQSASLTLHMKQEGIVQCNIRPLLFCGALLLGAPVQATAATTAACSRQADSPQSGAPCPERNASVSRHPFSTVFDVPSESPVSLLLATVMLGLLALRTGMR
jgi:hypothetical protein